MPPTKSPSSVPQTLEEIVAAAGDYSVDAFHFVQEGLQFAAERVHGPLLLTASAPDRTRHITGQQLCEGLRCFAIERWGLMARAVLNTWGVHATRDFGKIVFAMIDAELFQKQPNDTVEDFHNVFEFARAFDADYRISLPDALQ